MACSDTEVREIFTAYNCLACHSATLFESVGGELNLDSGNVGARLLARPSRHGGTACSDELLLDPEDASNSLLLKLVDADRYAALNETSCQRLPMPQTGATMDPVDVACIESWMENVILTEEVVEQEPEEAQAFLANKSGAVLSKAKYVLHGGAPTSEELGALGGSEATVDKADVEAVIIDWEASPEYEAKIKNFLALSLQQVPPNSERYSSQFNSISGNAEQLLLDRNKLFDNFNQMFVRTAWELVRDGGDFRGIVTTRKWQVTTAMLVALSYTDKEQQTEGRAYTRGSAEVDRLRAFSHLVDTDYDDWRTVTFTSVSAPIEYENSLAFAEQMRAVADEGSLGMRFPRVGFFSSPVFLEKWETNDDNQFRVTTHQTLIVALDKTFDPSDSTPHLTEDGIPLDHADPDTTCYQCHRHMDPMRLVFSNYQVSRSRSKAPDLTLQPSFSFMGVAQNFTDTDDFAEILANHPEFPIAWVQKLCMWGNSQRCDSEDPEFMRLSEAFVSSGYNFKLLLRDFFSSPLFTGASLVQTHENTEFLVSMSRGNHFCKALEHRTAALKQINGTIGDVRMCSDEDYLGIVPPDTFSRGAADFVQNTQLGSFDAKSIDLKCAQASSRFFASNDNKIINYTVDQDLAFEQLVQYIMGIPENHERYATVLSELRRIYDISFHRTACEGIDAWNQEGDVECGLSMGRYSAFRNVWFAACTSPDLISVGM